MELQIVARALHGGLQAAVERTAHGGEKDRAVRGHGLRDEAVLGLAEEGLQLPGVDVDGRAPIEDFAVFDEAALHGKRKPQIKLFGRARKGALVNAQDGLFDDDGQGTIPFEKGKIRDLQDDPLGGKERRCRSRADVFEDERGRKDAQPQAGVMDGILEP